MDDLADPNVVRITPDTDLNEALRLLTRENAPQILLVTSVTESPGGALWESSPRPTSCAYWAMGQVAATRTPGTITKRRATAVERAGRI